MTENSLVALYCIVDDFIYSFPDTSAGKKNLALYYAKRCKKRRKGTKSNFCDKVFIGFENHVRTQLYFISNPVCNIYEKYIPIVKLRRAYKIAIAICPDFISSNVSKPKVEYVVNPPQIPTFKKSNNFGFRLFFKFRETTNPMTKHPVIFIKKVFTGNEKFSLTGINPIKYLKIEPIAPPSPTNKQVNI